MKINQKIFLYLLVLSVINLQNINSKWQARFSSKEHSLNNTFPSHHNFQKDCQAERAARQRQQQIEKFNQQSQSSCGQSACSCLKYCDNKHSKNTVDFNNHRNNLTSQVVSPKILPCKIQQNSNRLQESPEDIKIVIDKYLKDTNTLELKEKNQEQIITNQKIILFASKAVECFKNSDKLSQGLDMLAVTSMANKLNKQNNSWAAIELIDQYLESSKLISNSNWTDNQERKDLNIKLLNTASSISYASMLNEGLDQKVPESLIACSGLTSAAMQLTRDENIGLDIPKKLQNLTENIINAGSQLAKVAVSAEKRSLYLVFDYFINPVETASKLFVGGVLGAARAVKNFNPIETVSAISHSIKDGVRFLANFVTDLGLDHEEWLKNYDYSEKVLAICNTIENATTEQIGEVLGEGIVDQILFDKTLKIVGKSLSILAASVKRTMKPGIKLHEILTTLKDSAEFSKPELEIIAATEGGAEAIVFTEAAEEITKDLSNFSQSSNVPINSPTRTAAQLSKLSEFQSGVTDLINKYGPKILEDAQQALRVSETKIIHNDVPELLEKLDKFSQDIKYIVESKPHRANFIYDISEAGKVKESSIHEALIACAAEDWNIINGKLSRAKDAAYDFLDELNNKWDVKNAISKIPNNTKYKFNPSVFASEIINELNLGENILLDISNLSKEDLKALEGIFKSRVSDIKTDCIIVFVNRNKSLYWNLFGG